MFPLFKYCIMYSHIEASHATPPHYMHGFYSLVGKSKLMLSKSILNALESPSVQA